LNHRCIQGCVRGEELDDTAGGDILFYLGELEAALRLGANESEVYYHLARAYDGLGRPGRQNQSSRTIRRSDRKQKEDVEAQRRALRLMEEAGRMVDAGNLFRVQEGNPGTWNNGASGISNVPCNGSAVLCDGVKANSRR
jgi:hypothetical protein